MRKRGLCCRPVSVRPSVTLVYSIHTADKAARSQLRSASRHQVVVPRYNPATTRAGSAVGPSLSLAQRSGTHCQTSSATHHYRLTVSVASLKHSCLQYRSSVHSTLEIFLLMRYINLRLLTYLLTIGHFGERSGEYLTTNQEILVMIRITMQIREFLNRNV